MEGPYISPGSRPAVSQTRSGKSARAREQREARQAIERVANPRRYASSIPDGSLSHPAMALPGTFGSPGPKISPTRKAKQLEVYSVAAPAATSSVIRGPGGGPKGLMAIKQGQAPGPAPRGGRRRASRAGGGSSKPHGDVSFKQSMLRGGKPRRELLADSMYHHIFSKAGLQVSFHIRTPVPINAIIITV